MYGPRGGLAPPINSPYPCRTEPWHPAQKRIKGACLRCSCKTLGWGRAYKMVCVLRRVCPRTKHICKNVTRNRTEGSRRTCLRIVGLRRVAAIMRETLQRVEGQTSEEIQSGKIASLPHLAKPFLFFEPCVVVSKVHPPHHCAQLILKKHISSQSRPQWTPVC